MNDDGYEIHSILEFGDVPSEGLWWVLSPSGKSPSIRAGAGSLIIPHARGFDEAVILSGGATPAGFVSDIVKLDLIHGEWKSISNKGFQPRYEHGMCFDEQNNFMAFLGTGNEELAAQCFENQSWSKSELPISPRTVSQCTSHNGKTYIWSGGCTGGIISDNLLYIIEKGNVKKEKLSGELPPVRQENAMCTNGDFLFIHGGLGQDGKKLSDLYKVNLRTFRSKKCTLSGSLVRAMHKMVIFEQKLLIFGGLNETDVISNDLFQLTPIEGTNKYTINKLDFETKPTPRIAFNFHIINLPIRSNSLQSAEPSNCRPDEPKITPVDDWKVTIDSQNITLPQTGPEQPQAITQPVDLDSFDSKPVLFIHGGCDTEGEFFNDIFVSCIPV